MGKYNLEDSGGLVSLSTTRNWDNFEQLKGSSSPFKGMGLVLVSSSIPSDFRFTFLESYL